MVAMNATDARKKFFQLLQRVNDDCEHVEIVSSNGNAVLMSLDEYESMRETLHVLGTPENAVRLLHSMQQAKSGTTEEHELVK